MNRVVLIGRLTKEPDVRQTQQGMCVARYYLAVDRRFKRDGEPDADFLNCVAFGKAGEFAEKWLHKGMKIAVTGRIQTGSYTNKDGFKVYTTDIIVDDQEFCESKGAAEPSLEEQTPEKEDDGFVDVPDFLDDQDLPFR